MQISPIFIPIIGMLIPIVVIIGGMWGKAHADRVKADQRMAMLARGHSLAEIDAVLKMGSDVDGHGRPPKDPLRSLGSARRTAVVLISVGLGTILFFFVLHWILRQVEVLAGAAAGLIPLTIGLGFVVDYWLQKREMARFGLEVEGDRRP
jgi:hypothetical protein